MASYCTLIQLINNTLNTFNNYPYALAVFKNGDLICVGSNFEIHIKNLTQISSGSEESKIVLKSCHTRSIARFAVFSNGDFASASVDNTVKIWKRN